MIRIPGPASPHEMRVRINGEPAAYVLACVCEEKRRCDPVCPVGACECAAVAVGARTYEVELRQFTTDLYAGWLDKTGFELSVETQDELLLFSGCEWTEVRRQIQSGGDMIGSVRIAACTMERRGSDAG